MVVQPYYLCSMHSSDFPTTDRFLARTVTELDFDLKHDIQELGLYVNLSDVRSNAFREDIMYQLSVENSVLVNLTDDYQKILFSGHKGCGKTTELKRLHEDLNNPNAYLSILVELEKETYLSQLEPEDIFVLLLLKVVEELDERDAKFSSKELEELAKEWLSDEEIINEVYSHSGRERQVGVETPLSELLALKVGIKSMWAAGSKTTKAIRTKVKQNPTELIDRFNLLLGELRLAMDELGLGKDLLFIIDGSEKMRHETYTDLFIKDSMLLRKLDCNMVVAVPIDAYYTIEKSPARAFTHSVTIPMVKTKGAAADRLKQIITCRLDSNTFFDEGVLDYFVKYSGGCVRQLLLLVNQGLMRSRGKLITLEFAASAAQELGQRLYEQLELAHIELLKKNDPIQWPPGEEAVRKMLFNLALLKYNGKSGINPLIEQQILGTE